MLTTAILFALTGSLNAGNPKTPPTQKSVEARVDALMSKMSLEDKIDFIGGYQAFYTHPMEKLGLPAIKMSDGPAGVHNYGPDTAYTSPVTMAASWDPELARRVGRSFGLDARQRGVHIVLAPGVNINRVPMNGRNFEYLGEDPFLASTMVVPWIQGIQGEGVIATIKHFAANSQEHGRTEYSMNVDERTLREIYFPAFEAAVKKANVWSVMCSYNLLNGTYTSANRWLLTDVLKKDWGFKGFVMSDWGAVHDSVPVVNSGMDLEMPGPEFMNRKTILPAIKAGTVKVATIDDKVRRMLRSFVSMGFLDRPQTKPELPTYNPEGAQATYQEAKEGMVLLKNEKNVLPLSVDRVKKIAVIGPNAYPAVWGGGGSAFVTPFRATSVLDAITAKVGSRVQVGYAQALGAPSPEVFRDSKFTNLTGEYFNNRNLEGTPKATRSDRRINFKWEQGPIDGIGHDGFSVRWTATLKPSETGEYEFDAQGDDGFRAFVDGKKIIDAWQEQGETNVSGKIKLYANQTYKVVVEYFQAGGDAVMRFGYRTAGSAKMNDAVRMAKNSDAAILCVGFNQGLEGEGDDRTFALPAGQDDLILQVAAANPNTIVVLNSGASVDATKWIGKVRGLIQAWYPGQDGNNALADIIFGDVNPSGKLPMTFDRTWQDSAAYGNYPGNETKSVDYKEGIFVGYRHYDKVKKSPLFPFGFGLSYTSYAYSGIKVDRLRTPDINVKVTFTVRNTGKRAGAEVAQVYVQPKGAPVPRPLKELKGFSRISLAPGESKQVTVNLDMRSFAFWDTPGHNWAVAHGEYNILVGGSSKDLPLVATVRL